MEKKREWERIGNRKQGVEIKREKKKQIGEKNELKEEISGTNLSEIEKRARS